MKFFDFVLLRYMAHCGHKNTISRHHINLIKKHEENKSKRRKSTTTKTNINYNQNKLKMRKESFVL